jgi:segregation and condensation protein B
MNQEKIQSAVESILFVSGEPVKKMKLAKIADATLPEIEIALAGLVEKYADVSSGLFILLNNEEIQLASKPENGHIIEELVKSELTEGLSPAALEVLSIIAYRSPISKPEIEAVRGVNCNYTLRNLLLRKLIEKNDNPKDSRGFVYNISFDFLKKMGIDNVEKLPDYAILSKDERGSVIVEN